MSPSATMYDSYPTHCSDRSLRIISCVVIAAHFFLIGILIGLPSSSSPTLRAAPKRFVVQTVDLLPSTPTKAATANTLVAQTQEVSSPAPIVEKSVLPMSKPQAAPSPKKASSKKQAEPSATPKKEERGKEQVKKNEPKKAPLSTAKKTQPPPKQEKAGPKKLPVEAKKATEAKKLQGTEKAGAERSPRQQQLLKQAQERIAKIEPTRDKNSTTKNIGASLTALSVPLPNVERGEGNQESNSGGLSEREASYRDELARRLKLMLKLPEHGEVKIKLTLEKSGKVASLVIVSTMSEANRIYIEKTLPGMAFPAFGTQFGSAYTHTFSVTLSNE